MAQTPWIASLISYGIVFELNPIGKLNETCSRVVSAMIGFAIRNLPSETLETTLFGARSGNN